MLDPTDEMDTHPSSALLADTGPFPPLLCLTGSPSADTLNRSSTSPVFMDPNPAFCWVTTELATSNLNRCSLRPRHQLVRHVLPRPISLSESDLVTPTHPMIFSSKVPLVISRYTLTTFFCPNLCALSIACRSFIGFQS